MTPFSATFFAQLPLTQILITVSLTKVTSKFHPHATFIIIMIQARFIQN